jgi:PHD/YefM family antitoxin component YafN of YafNO toxin-antitoxin module
VAEISYSGAAIKDLEQIGDYIAVYCMKFLSVRELRSSTAHLKEMLPDNGKVVLTTNGKPAALIIEVDEESFEETMDDLRAARARRAIRRIQEQSVRAGLDSMTLDEINAEINSPRAGGVCDSLPEFIFSAFDSL